MSKEIIVRQNECDREMNFLSFGCFFLYLGVQVLAGNTQQQGLSGAVGLLLYAVFVPGFVFRLGYCYGRMVRRNSQSFRRKWLRNMAVRYYLYFFLLSFVWEGIQLIAASPDFSVESSVFLSVAVEILSLLRITSVPAAFITLALMLLLVWIFDGVLCRIAEDKRKIAAAVTICFLCAFLRSKTASYEVVAALFGADGQAAVPGVPYFGFFVLGCLFQEKKPGFRWKLGLAAAACTAVSLLLYRTPLQDLCRVTMSLLPVYVVYCAAEGLSELTPRFQAARYACDLIEPVFGVYSLLMFFISAGGFMEGRSVAVCILASAAVIVLIYAVTALFFLFSRVYGLLSEYIHNRAKHKTAVYFAVYTVAFSFMLFLVFFEFFRTGTTFIVKGDGVSQYYPRVIYFVRYIRSLISGVLSGNFELPMYDFTIGMGAEITYSLEPLYFLYALFDEAHLEFAYNLVTVLRFYLAGVSMSVLCLYFRKSYYSAFLASVIYVISGFALFGGSRHTMFMIPMIMLPLLILAMEEIIRKKRWYLCTVFVAVSLLGNYYYLYMNTIAMGVYFLVRFFCQKDRTQKTVRNFFGRAFTICGAYLLGVGMSCIVLVTTFGMYLGSGRGEGVVIKTPSMFFYSVDWLVSCFLTFVTTVNSPGEWLKLGYLPIAFLAVIFLFLREGRKELKIFSVIAVIFAAFPLFGFIFSGFSSVINRWCYMISLLAAYITADCFDDMRRMNRREIRVCTAVSLLYGFLVFFGAVRSTRYTKIAFFLLLVTLGVLVLCRAEQKKLSEIMKKSLMLWLTAVIVFYQGFSLYYMDGGVNGYARPGDSASVETDTPLRAVAELEDDSFYRIAAPKLSYYTSNASFLLGYNSTTLVCSTYNGYIMEFLEKMGATSYSPTQLLGMCNQTILNNLAAIKYYAEYDGTKRPVAYGADEVLKTVVDGNDTTVYANRYALPLGYTCSESITGEELESYSVTERQEVLMQKVLLNDAEADKGTSDVSITSKELEITRVKENGITLTDNAMTAGADGKSKKKYRLKLKFKGEENSETYIVLKNAFMEGDMSEASVTITFTTGDNTLSYAFAPDDYRYKTGQSDFVFNLGYHEEALTSCTITMSRAATIQFDSFGVYSQSMDNIESYTEALTQDVLENVEISTNHVSGSISLDEDKILVLSIPYQKGWTAYVDGEEARLERADYMYMALELEPGDHTIELSFAIPGVKYALVIMLCSVILFIILCVTTWSLRKRKMRKNRVE